MLISHKHQFIFIKTEKTAGTSLEIALSGICGPEDIITPISEKDEQKRREIAGGGARNYVLPKAGYRPKDWFDRLVRGKTPVFYNHMPAKHIKRCVPEAVWRDYYKFAFERNPWDKLISWYYWKTKKDKNPVSIDEFVASGAAAKVRGFDLYSLDGRPAVDDLFKFEDLDGALQTISAKLDLDTPLQMPNYRAKSGKRKEKAPYSELLSDDARREVERYAAREIELLNYEF